MVGPSRGVDAGGVSPSHRKRGSSETIGTLFCIENTYRHPYTFESTLHCQRSTCRVCMAILCARGSISHESIKSCKLLTQHSTGPCRTGNY